MNAGLVYLLRKRPVGWLRVVRRRTRRAKGLLTVLGALAVAVLLIGPQVFVAMEQSAEQTAAAVAGIRRWGPAALTLMALLSASSGAGLFFRQCEIDLLFPAPVGRRELLLYHVLGRLMVVALSSLWVAIFVLRWAPRWYAGLTGIFFALCFVQLLAQLASLLLSAVSVRLARRLRRALLLGVAVLCAAGVLAAGRLAGEATFAEALVAFVDSTPVAVVTAPAAVFVETFAAPRVAEYAPWAAAGLAVLAALFGVIAWLDVAYTEGAVRASRQVQQRLQRMRSGGGAAAAHAPGAARVSVPRAPWLGGAGPIMWRQGVEALRSSRGIAVTALMTIGMPVLFVMLSASGGNMDGDAALPMGLTLILMMTAFMNQNLALDFRRDLDRMAYLKSLPLPPAAVALGQIVPGIAVFTVLQAVAIALLTLALGVALPFPALLLPLALLPFTWLSMALDNVLFLLFPYRFTPKEAGGVQFMGRAMTVMFVKLLALMLACAVAGLAGWLLWELAGRSIALGAATAGAVLSVIAVVLTWILGRVFAGFDVTVDVPG